MKKILTFAKRELKSHFDHPGGYVVVVVFLGLALFLYFRSVLVVHEASLRPLFSVLPWLLLFLVPAVTMRAIAGDEKEGVSEVFLSQPVTSLQYLLGKFLGSMAAVLIGVLATLPALIVLSLYGSFDWGLAGAQYLGTIFLVAAMTAVGFFASGLTKNQIVAFIISIAILFGLVIIGWEAALGSVSPTLAAILQNLSILWHFSNITRGVLDLRDVIYFLSIVAVFGALSYAGFMRPRLTRFSPLSRRISSWVLAIAALAIVWNGAVQYIPLRLDLTSGRLYTLSPATKRIARELKEPVTLKLFVSQNLPTEMALAVRDVEDTLSEYRSVGKGNIVVETVHPESDAQKQEAVTAGVPPIQFNVVREGEFQVKEGYFGITVSKKDVAAEVIPYISKTDDFEYQVSRLIHRTTQGEKKTIAFLGGHGEKSAGGYNAYRQELQKSFTVEDITLSTATSLAATSLPKTDVLVVAGPEDSIGESEQNIITEYLKNGGKAFFLIDGAKIDFSTLAAEAANSTNTKFVADLTGVSVRPGIVYDFRANENVQFNTGGPMTYVLPYVFWARVGAATGSPITKDLQSVVYTWGAALDIMKEGSAGGESTPLLKTTQYASEQKENFVLQPNKDFPIDKSTIGERVTAVMVKNILQGTGRAVVTGSSTMLTDQVLGGKPQNITFGLNVLDWLAENEDLISIRSKTAEARTLTFPSPESQSFVQYGIMLGIPLFVVAIAALRLFLRRKKTHRVFDHLA